MQLDNIQLQQDRLWPSRPATRFKQAQPWEGNRIAQSSILLFNCRSQYAYPLRNGGLATWPPTSQ